MNKIYLFRFRKKQHNKIEAAVVVHSETKRAIDLVLKAFPKDSKKADWSQGYDCVRIGESGRAPVILLSSIFTDPGKEKDCIEKAAAAKFINSVRFMNLEKFVGKEKEFNKICKAMLKKGLGI